MKYLLLILPLVCCSRYSISQGMTSPGCAPEITPPEKKAEGIITVFETAKPASFFGGQKELAIFLRDNCRFPKEARLAGIQGVEVFISFVVEKNGALTDIQICRDIGYGLGEEAVRLAKLMPNWCPAEVDGHLCRIWMNLPIRLRSPEK